MLKIKLKVNVLSTKGYQKTEEKYDKMMVTSCKMFLSKVILRSGLCFVVIFMKFQNFSEIC